MYWTWKGLNPSTVLFCTPPPTIYLHYMHKDNFGFTFSWLFCPVFIYCWFRATIYLIILQSVIVSQEITYCGQTFGVQTKLRIHTAGFENVVIFIVVLCGTLFLKAYFIFLHIILFCPVCSECCPHTFVYICLQFSSIHTSTLNLFSPLYRCPDHRNCEFSFRSNSLCVPSLNNTCPTLQPHLNPSKSLQL